MWLLIKVQIYLISILNKVLKVRLRGYTHGPFICGLSQFGDWFHLYPSGLLHLRNINRRIKWGIAWQKQVLRAGTSNYIPQILWNVISCSCSWYPLVPWNVYIVTLHFCGSTWLTQITYREYPSAIWIVNFHKVDLGKTTKPRPGAHHVHIYDHVSQITAMLLE